MFHENKAKFNDFGGKATVEWMSQLPYDKWTLAYSPDITRYEKISSNDAEQFNSWIKNAALSPSYICWNIFVKVTNMI